jgi:exodeoxyribonuclease-3
MRHSCPRRAGATAASRSTPSSRRASSRASACQEFDAEGRYLEAHFAELSVISVYLPSGSSGPHRQASKFRFLEVFLPHLAKLRSKKREIVLCGDWNIAHREIDLKNWRSNRKNSGFLPEEREWLTRVFDELGFVDVFRRLDPRPTATRGGRTADRHGRTMSAGGSTIRLRHPASPPRRGRPRSTRTAAFSDHAPLVIDYLN